MFLPFFVLVGFCIARPSPGGSTLPTSTASLAGFPAELLPPWNVSGGSGGNLSVPLSPGGFHHLEQRFARGPSLAGDFRGGQLISSIISQLEPIWRSSVSTAFTPIIRTVEDINGPYRNILHTIHPFSSSVNPDAVLTPLKVGIVYCWMLRLAPQWPSWSGHIVASIYNGEAGALGALLGWINVENLLQTRTSSTAAASEHNDSTASMDREGDIVIGMSQSTSSSNGLSEIPKAIRERSWLECLVSLLIPCIKFPPSAPVVDNLPAPAPSQRALTFHYRSRVDPKMEGNLTIYPDAGRRLKFHHMVQTLQALVISVTERDIWDNKEHAAIKPEGGPIIARISFGRTWRDDRPHQVTIGNGIALSQS